MRARYFAYTAVEGGPVPAAKGVDQGGLGGIAHAATMNARGPRP